MKVMTKKLHNSKKIIVALLACGLAFGLPTRTFAATPARNDSSGVVIAGTKIGIAPQINIPFTSDAKACTAGVKWKYTDGKIVFLTAGHCNVSGALEVRWGRLTGNSATPVRAYGTQYKPPTIGLNGDWSMLKSDNASNIAGNLVYNAGATSNATSAIVGQGTDNSGLSVCVSGGTSGLVCGYTTGSLVATSAPVTIEGKKIATVRKMSRPGACLNGGGDSGAPVILKSGSAYLVLGILSGGSASGNTCNAYYTPLSKIPGSLVLS